LKIFKKKNSVHHVHKSVLTECLKVDTTALLASSPDAVPNKLRLLNRRGRPKNRSQILLIIHKFFPSSHFSEIKRELLLTGTVPSSNFKHFTRLIQTLPLLISCVGYYIFWESVFGFFNIQYVQNSLLLPNFRIRKKSNEMNMSIE